MEEALFLHIISCPLLLSCRLFSFTVSIFISTLISQDFGHRYIPSLIHGRHGCTHTHIFADHGGTAFLSQGKSSHWRSGSSHGLSVDHPPQHETRAVRLATIQPLTKHAIGNIFLASHQNWLPADGFLQLESILKCTISFQIDTLLITHSTSFISPLFNPSICQVIATITSVHTANQSDPLILQRDLSFIHSRYLITLLYFYNNHSSLLVCRYILLHLWML